MNTPPTDLFDGATHIYWGAKINTIIKGYINLYEKIKNSIPDKIRFASIDYCKFAKFCDKVYISNKNIIFTPIKFGSESILHELYPRTILSINGHDLLDIWVDKTIYSTNNPTLESLNDWEFQIHQTLNESMPVLTEYRDIVASHRSIHTPRIKKGLNKWINLIDEFGLFEFNN